MIPEPLLRPVRRVALRVRVQRAIDGAASLALAGLGAAAVALLLAKLGALAEGDARAMLAVALATPFVGAILGAIRPVPLLVAARMLDRSHATEGRIAAALELAGGERTEWAESAIRDAAARAAGLRASIAAPLRAPRDLAPALGLSCAVGLLASLEIPRRVELPLAQGITPLVLHEDDLDAYQERLRDVLARDIASAEVRDEAEALNRVIEDLVDRRIDREETLRRLAEIEARIAARPPADASLLRDELRAMGQELRRAESARPLAEALSEADPASAEPAMRDIAERLRSDPPSRQELERLRRALDDAAAQRRGEEEDALERHEEETERLLQRRRERGASEQEQARLLEQRQRELERLRREHQAQQEARRRLDRLRRELEEAARDLDQGGGGADDAGEDLDEGADDLNRMARQQMSEEQMQELARQLEELRELVRRQRERQAGGQGGEGQEESGGHQGRAPSRMDRFVLRARGEGEGGGMPIGAPGGGQQGQGETPGTDQQGAQGGQQGSGRGSETGGGEGGEAQQMLMLGQGGDAELEIPGLGGRREGDEREGAGGSGEPESPGGGAGHEHDPAMLGDPTRLGGAERTVQVRGEHGRGPSRSEVIHSASQRGFAGRSYRDVYSEYAGHAEEVIERDEVPPGYRFYVRRYFQLIRPRDGE